MVQVILVGLVAGLAAALLFVAPLGGTPLAVPLFVLTGLPIAIAGFGWGSIAMLIAAAGAAALSFILDDVSGGVVFLLLFAIPVTWATAAAIEPRPGTNGRTWRPLGIVLTHAAIAVAVGVIGAGLVFGYDPPALTQDITTTLVNWAANADLAAGLPPTAAEIRPMVQLNVALLPATLGIIGVVLVMLDLYLAAKSVGFSGNLRRPAESLASVSLPMAVPTAFVGAILVTFAPGSVGHAAEAVAGTLGAAVALVGLAVIHALTRGLSWRVPLLAIVYALVLLSGGLPIVLFALIGLAESMFHLRQRRFRPRGPTPTT